MSDDESELKTTVPLYAVRHRPTGNYIPRPMGRGGRGGSHLEPVMPTEAKETRPRFFETKRSAKIFLSSWLKGKYVADRGCNHGHPGSDWEVDYFEDVLVVPVLSRKAEDMEIVEYCVDLYTR